MKNGTKTLAQLIREAERALDRADEKLFEWVCEYEATLQFYETRRKGVTLKDKYGSEDVSRRVEADGIEVYEFDFSSPNCRSKCTARAIKRLRVLEKKIEYWNNKRDMAERAVEALS